MLDHAGRRRGAVEVLRVVELPFSEVGEDVVAADDSVASVAEWRAGHRAFYDGCRDEVAFLIGEPGWRLTDEEPMIVLFYRYVPDTDEAPNRSDGTPARAPGGRRRLAVGPRQLGRWRTRWSSRATSSIPLSEIVVRTSRSSGPGRPARERDRLAGGGAASTRPSRRRSPRPSASA